MTEQSQELPHHCLEAVFVEEPGLPGVTFLSVICEQNYFPLTYSCLFVFLFPLLSLALLS